MDGANESGPAQLGNDGGRRILLRHALAGLQAGVLGALVLVACLMIGSLWNGRSVWVVPNLFATTFFGSDVYRNQLLRTSWTGIALTVVAYGALGAFWGCIWRDQRKPWLGLYGAVAGLCAYFLLYGAVWRHVNPLLTLYAPDRQLQLGHVLWGIVLARSPLYSRRIADSVRNQTPPPPGVQDVAVQEVSSGEVIR
jgi:hypothetical protein